MDRDVMPLCNNDGTTGVQRMGRKGRAGKGGGQSRSTAGATLPIAVIGQVI